MIQFFIDLHEQFFDNDMGNKIVTGMGVGIGAVFCALWFLLY